MKKMNVFLPLMTLFLALAVSAFTAEESPEKKASTFTNWYEYRGPLPATEQDLTDESNYFLVDGPAGCNSDQQICAIQVAGTGEHPSPFSSQVEEDILEADQNNLPIQGYIEMKP